MRMRLPEALLERAFTKGAVKAEGIDIGDKYCTLHIEHESNAMYPCSVLTDHRFKWTAYEQTRCLMSITERFNGKDPALYASLHPESNPLERSIVMGLAGGVLQTDFVSQAGDDKYIVERGCISGHFAGKRAVVLSCKRFIERLNGSCQGFAISHDVGSGLRMDTAELTDIVKDYEPDIVGIDSCVAYSGQVGRVLEAIQPCISRLYFFGGHTTFPPDIVLGQFHKYGTRWPRKLILQNGR